MRILIAEDEPIIALDLELVLQGMGHEVCALASTAEEAVQCAQAQMPDAVIMDINLGHHTSGVDAARILFFSCGLRCIFISGSLDWRTQQTLSQFDPIAFLEKPLVQEQLESALQTVCAP